LTIGNKKMTPSPITGKQMKRLQTLWGLFCRQGNLDAKDREARLAWVAGAIGRQIGSFKELAASEAATAIEAVQKHLPPELLRRARPSRRAAQAYGTAGRKSANKCAEVRMADRGTLQLLANLLTSLGWTRERLDAFLRSSKSPVRSGKIRTLAEANRVIWVLKSFLRRASSAPTQKRSSPDHASTSTAPPDCGQAAFAEADPR
jgi:hypothetical protein